MLTELRTKSQITIPKDIVKHLGLAEGDKLDVVEKDGVIQIIPVAVYPKKYLEELRGEIDEAKARVAAGEQPTFDSVDALFDMLDGELMAYKITYTKRFLKNVKKLNGAERAQLKKKLELLMQDPLYPSLRTKRIQGTSDLFEFSVNMDVRVIWSYDGETLILLLDIGHHDILNQF